MVSFGVNNGIQNNIVHGNDYELPNVGEHLPPLNWVMLAVGSTGSGKTTATINLIKEYQKFKAFDNIALVSPTAVPDANSKSGFVPETKFQKNLKITELYDKLTDNVIKKIKDNQNQRIDDYMTYLEMCKVYKRIMREDPTLTDDQILNYYDKYGFKAPTCEYKHMPTLLIICDDITNSARLTILSDFASKSRHCCASMCVLCQSLVQMSPTLRQQASVMILFKTASLHVIQTVYEEMANSDMPIEEFVDIMKLPQSKKDFILINLKEIDKNRRYRLNFNQYLMLGNSNDDDILSGGLRTRKAAEGQKGKSTENKDGL
jgi:thymidine kinase